VIQCHIRCSHIIYIQFTTHSCVTYDARLYTYASYHRSISFITRDGTHVTVTIVQSFQVFISFTFVRYLSTYYQIIYVFQLLQVVFNLLVILFCKHTSYRILDYYSPHVVVHNHAHMFGYKSTHLVIS